MSKKRIYNGFTKFKSIINRIDLYLYRNYIILKKKLFKKHKRFSSFLALFVLFLILSVAACHITQTPEKIYGLRDKIINLANSLKGIKYKYGGTDIYGFDCSGFVFYVFDSFGIKIPRTARKQGKAGKKIRLNSAQKGDIVVFKLKRSWHSGILNKKKGIKYFIHAPNRKSYIREEKLTKYWLSRLKYVVKVL